MAAGLHASIETTTGGVWRIAGCRDYWSTYEHRFHISPTVNQHDAIDAVELALADYQALFSPPTGRRLPGRSGQRGAGAR